MQETPRSRCPISLALDVFGDRWTLLVIRDIVFAGKRRFREILESDEHIASNILTERLGRLVEQGILTKSADPTHKQKAIYSLTERGIDLVPILVEMSAWSAKHMPADPALASIAVRLKKRGGHALKQLIAALRKEHLTRRG